MAVVAFFVAMFGSIFGVWKYLDSKLVALRAEAQALASTATAMASLAREELAAHRLHVAETFATKAGLQEQTGQLLRAIEGVGNRIDGMNERLDRAFESQAPRRRMAS